MSTTTSARSRSGPSTSRSARIPSSMRPSGASGWRRRVSLKRSTSVSSLGLEEDERPAVEPPSVELVEDREQVVEVLAAAHVGDHRGPADAELCRARKSSPSEAISRGGRLSTQK